MSLPKDKRYDHFSHSVVHHCQRVCQVGLADIQPIPVRAPPDDPWRTRRMLDHLLPVVCVFVPQHLQPSRGEA